MDYLAEAIWRIQAEDGDDLARRVAGLLIFRADEKALVVRRSPHETRAGQWENPGGHVQEGESDVEGALREGREELGGLPDDLTVVTSEVQPPGENSDVLYTTVIAYTEDRSWNPNLNEEHDKFLWADARSLPENLHPGAKQTLLDYSTGMDDSLDRAAWKVETLCAA